MLTHTTRALQLLMQAIAEVDTVEELARVQMTAHELYSDDAETLAELIELIEARATVLRTQLHLFPAERIELPPDRPLEAAPPELVREWCEQVRTMGPDELSALEELTNKHWEYASLRELRGAIKHRWGQLDG